MIPEPARFPRSILNERCRYCCVRGLPGEHGTRCERRQADSAVSFAPRARAATHPVAKLSSKTSRLWWWAALTLVLSPAWGELVDSTIYGGTFHSTSTVAYAEVVQTCFGGLEVGSCAASSPDWLEAFLAQRSSGATGAYCASCCTNVDDSNDVWRFECELISASFAEFINHFGWEFRFARRQSSSDREIVTCPIPRSSCDYDDGGALVGACESDGSYLAAYVLTLDVLTVESGLKTWKSVQGCTVAVTESVEQPSVLLESLEMVQVYESGSGIETGWAVLIALVAFGMLSCGVRFTRDDRCIICGHHLIWFREVCSPCQFLGYEPPSNDVKKIIQDKRSVVLPDATFSDQIGRMTAKTTKVFVRATDGLRSTRAFANTRLAREYVDDSGCNAAKVGRRRENVESNGLGNRGRYDCRSVSPINTARSVTFAGNKDESGAELPTKSEGRRGEVSAAVKTGEVEECAASVPTKTRAKKAKTPVLARA